MTKVWISIFRGILTAAAERHVAKCTKLIIIFNNINFSEDLAIYRAREIEILSFCIFRPFVQSCQTYVLKLCMQYITSWRKDVPKSFGSNIASRICMRRVQYNYLILKFLGIRRDPAYVFLYFSARASVVACTN